MPEYLAPGVFVEETSFRQKTIEGVSTSTTGFVGPTRFGPTDGEPPLLTSFSDFERIYGGLDQIRFEDFGQQTHNYLAHAVRAYFEEGGKRLYVSRVFEATDSSDGVARWTDDSSPFSIRFEARYPGRAGIFTARLVFKVGDNILVPGSGSPPNPDDNRLVGARPYDVVVAQRADASPNELDVYWVERFFDQEVGRESFRLRQDDPDADPDAASPSSAVSLSGVEDVRVVTVSLIVQPVGRFADELAWEDLTFSLRHRDESLASLLAAEPTRRSIELFVPLVLQVNDSNLLDNGAALATQLLQQRSVASSDAILTSLTDANVGDEHRTLQIELTGGNDGNTPDAGEYEGTDGERKSGLRAFEDIEDISIIAAPGSTFRSLGGASYSDPITLQLISHCERMRYRIAVLDSLDGQDLGSVQERRSAIDTTRAAFYYPWVRIFDPVTETEVFQPPSGFVTGIYARNDVERGVHKAPANEVVRLAMGFEFLINKAQQEVLNPKGINCLRFFEGRGFRVWGARTASSDPEWKYVNVRRYFAFLERSIEKGTQWAVFENNGDILWANIRRTVEDFLFNEWKENHLMGTKPEQAFFVRCDRTTMTQNDIDNGRLICLIGVAPLRPAEFVIFRIGQKTADARS